MLLLANKTFAINQSAFQIQSDFPSKDGPSLLKRLGLEVLLTLYEMS